MKKLLLILSCIMANTAVQAADWSSANSAAIDKFAIPAYEQLQNSSHTLVKSSKTFCTDANDASFDTLKKAFNQTMDAWQSIQILRSGPADSFMRSFRLEMWPDRSNAAAKHLRKLQKEANPEQLEAKKFARASTAVQGLSALERVLYAKDIKVSAFQTDGNANFKCQLVQAISLNVQTIATDLLNAWKTDYRDLLTKPGKDNDYFESDKLVAAQFLNDLNTQLQAIIEQKINRPMDGKHFRSTRAESWRSQRSLRNILLNLTAAHQLYQQAFVAHISDEKLLKKQQTRFETTLTLGKELTMSFQQAQDQHTEKLQQWIKSIHALKKSITTELPVAVDIPLGFNSLDGD